jgi:TonB family protein
MRAILTMASAAFLLLACGSQPTSTPAAASEVPPKAESLVQPPYPENARKEGFEGTSIIEVTIGADGAVLGCSLATGSGNGSLDQAALDAARSSKFVPGTRDGKPVEMKVKVPFRFKLEDKPKESRGQVPGGTYRAVWPDEPQCREARPSAREA